MDKSNILFTYHPVKKYKTKTNPIYYNEQKVLTLLVNQILKDKHLTRKIKITLEITNTRRGHATSQDKITIPEWAIKTSESYSKAYAIHEITHLIAGLSNGHNKTFKRIEKSLLKKYMDIAKVNYKHAYIYKAMDSNGNVVFDLNVKDNQITKES